MDKETLRRLEMLNQLSLTETQKNEVIGFFNERDDELNILNEVNTDEVKRMVHVMPIMTVVREDIAFQPFTSDELQEGAPETEDNYWCVPIVVE